MEAHRQLDLARRAKTDRVTSPARFLLLCVLLSSFLGGPPSTQGQEPAGRSERVATVQKFYDAKEWDEVVALTGEGAGESRDLSYLRGMALMHLGRYQEAKEVFSAGLRTTSRDAQLRVERAGAEYRLKDFGAAKADLRGALRFQPNDEYTLEFLGTIYLLEGNLDAALKYWNRIEKPRITSVALGPEPRLARKLLSSAIAFNAPQILEREAWQVTEARLQNLEIFPQQRLELTPSGDQDYSGILHLTQRDGRDNLHWTGLISLLSGTPYQTVYPDWYNIGDRAINFSSLVRWDAQKRRVFTSLEMPLQNKADRVLSVFLDARDENWNLSRTFSGSVSPITDLNLRSLEAGAEARVILNGSWTWKVGAAVIGRRFQNASPVTTQNAAFFTNSTSLKGWTGVRHTLLRVPERRFTVIGEAESQFGRGFKDTLGRFGSLGGALRADWLPHATGESDSLHLQVRASQTFGDVPLDQLYELGLDRDSTLWLRGHDAMVDGRKGGAPLGRQFVLINSEYDRTLYNGSFLRLQVGPLLDMGRITDSSGTIGDPRWLVDMGVQAKLRVLGSVSVVLSYGRDLRDGRGVFFGTTER